MTDMTAEQALKAANEALDRMNTDHYWTGNDSDEDALVAKEADIELIRSCVKVLSAPRAPDVRGMHTDYGYVASKDHPFFFYDPEGDGMVFCATEAEAKEGAEKGIDASLDDFWSESVDQICYGMVLSAATQVNRSDRPESLDQDGCDDGGTYWPEDCEFMCNYALQPLTADPAQDEPAKLPERLEVMERGLRNAILSESAEWAGDSRRCVWLAMRDLANRMGISITQEEQHAAATAKAGA